VIRLILVKADMSTKDGAPDNKQCFLLLQTTVLFCFVIHLVNVRTALV